MRDVVFTFCFATWDGAYERGMTYAQDRLLDTLLRHPGVRRLVVMNSFRSASRRVARRVLGRDRPFPASARVKLVGPLRVRARDPSSIAAVDRAYRRYDRVLERAADRCGLEDPVVLATHPLVAGFAPLEWARSATYYATDDWAAHYRHERLWSAFEQCYARLRTHQRSVCAVSKPLLDRIAPTGPYAVVPNGVEPKEWLDPPPPPQWLADLPRPLALYAGTLDARLDVAAIERTARRLRSGTVLLLGRLADPDLLPWLGRVANVCAHPRVARHELSAIVAAADVCILPHAHTPLTEAMSPLKVYEYVAAGRPVASTDLPPIRGIDPDVVLVGEGQDFADGVERALERGPAEEGKRREFIRRNSWGERHRRILELAFG